MTFVTRLLWSGAVTGPTTDPETFSRDLQVTFADHTLPVSAASEYHGDATRANPEQLFVGAISACQALTYLFLAARKGVHVISYSDDADGHLEMSDGKLRMTRVTLRPRIVLAEQASEARARELVPRAHAGCFIANSVTTDVRIEPRISVAAQRAVVDQVEIG